MITFLLYNYNWFYLFGIVIIISCIHSVVKRAKDKPKENISVDFNNLNDTNKEIRKFSKISDHILFLATLSWIIFGFWFPEKIYFIFILVISHLIPFLTSLGEIGTVKAMLNENGGKIDTDSLNERVDIKKYRKFFSFLDIIEIFAVIIIMISHFKIALFYLFAV